MGNCTIGIAGNYRIFSEEIRNYFWEVDTEYCHYVGELSKLHGIGPHNILLLRGWDYRQNYRDWIAVLENLIIYNGCKVIGDWYYMSPFQKNRFHQCGNNEIGLKEKPIEKINKWKLLDI